VWCSDERLRDLCPGLGRMGCSIMHQLCSVDCLREPQSDSWKLEFLLIVLFREGHVLEQLREVFGAEIVRLKECGQDD
jgi:hypothetical protein